MAKDYKIYNKICMQVYTGNSKVSIMDKDSTENAIGFLSPESKVPADKVVFDFYDNKGQHIVINISRDNVDIIPMHTVKNGGF